MPPTERTALLPNEITQDAVPQYTNEDDYSTEDGSDGEGSDSEEAVDMLINRYAGENMNAPGLSGSMGAFGTSLTRKTSMAFSYGHGGLSRTTSRSETLRHRPSRPSMARPTPGSRAPSRKPSIMRKRLSVDQRADIEDANDKRQGKYLVDISEFRFWLLFLSIFLTWFVACFDSTLMASSHPIISSYFDASNEASWFSTSFLLTSSAFSPIFARVSDTFGRRIPLNFGLLAFGLGTVWCALAPTLLHFILARALCGLGAGASISQGAILMSDLLPLRRRGSYLSLLNLSYGIGCSLGAALGGFLAETLGWRWEFGIQVPAVFAVLLVVWFATPANLGPQLAKKDPQPLLKTILSFDLLGSFFLASATMCLILCLNLGGNTLPWTHPLIPALGVLSLVFMTLLVYVEQRAAKPVLPLHMLWHIPRGNLVFSNFLMCMTMNTVLFNIPLYFQATLLDSPTRSGTRLALPFVANMATAFATGNIITYTGRIKPTLVLGYTMIVVGLFLLSFMTRGLPTYVYSMFVAVSMMGQGFSFPTVTMGLLSVTEPADMAVATATLMLFRNLGTVMGVAVSSLVSQNALNYYLLKLVEGPEKEKVIFEVRRAVEIIKDLSPTYQGQVIEAYSRALHVTFIQGIGTAAIALALVVFITLPRLSYQHKVEVHPAE